MGSASSHQEESTREIEVRSPVVLGEDERIQDLTRYYSAEKTREKTDPDDDGKDVMTTRESMVLLKQIFKKMDPTVMKSTSTVQGDIQLSFKYEFSKEVLLVKVIKCRELGVRDLRGRTTSPYVRLTIFPDEHRSGSKTTQVSQQPRNPTYHEIFSFPMEELELGTTKIIAQVWDQDIMGRDDFMGECIVQLADFAFHSNPVHTAWYSLQMETDLSISGDLEVSLSFTMPSTLVVTIHRALGLIERDIDEKPNPFVKVSIPGVAQVYETEVIEHTVEPEWGQSFEFSIPVEEFEFRYVTLHVLDYGDDGSDLDSLGQVIIDLNNLDPDHGFHGRFELADMRNNDKLRSKWFQSATVQEFREALLAHASVQYPKFLFQKQRGSKVITVSSDKAKAQAKLRIVNGIPVA